MAFSLPSPSSMLKLPIFSKWIRRKMQFFQVILSWLFILPISSFISKVRWLQKKGKQVTRSRRLQTKGETPSTLQRDKFVTPSISTSFCCCMWRVARELYQSSRFNDTNAFRKLEKYFSPHFSCTLLSLVLCACWFIWTILRVVAYENFNTKEKSSLVIPKGRN